MRDPGSEVGSYLGGLDGLRGAGCLAVLTAHCIGHFAPESTPNGVAQILVQGLMVFFALSGMLIYLPFARAIADQSAPVRVGRYARRRLMRIFPAYIVIFLVCDLAWGAVYVRNALDAAQPFSDAGTGRITNPVDLSLHLSLLHSLMPDQMQTGIPPSWSLMTELVFYLMLPIVVLIASGRRGWRLGWALAPPLVFFIIGIVGRFAVSRQFASSGLSVDQAEFGSHWLAVASRSLLAFADTFAVGMVVAVVFAWTERGRWPRWTSRRAVVVGWVLIAVGTAGGLLLLNVQHWFVGTLTSLVAAGLLLLVTDASVRGRPTWVSRLAAVSPLRRVGEISYSVYLWHMPVMVLVSRLGWFRTDSLTTLAGATGLVAAVSIALGSVTFALIERPAMRWASR